MMSAAFSAIMMTGALVLPEVTAGMIEASTTRRRCSPFTLHGEHKNTHRYNVRTDNPFTLHSEHKNTSVQRQDRSLHPARWTQNTHQYNVMNSFLEISITEWHEMQNWNPQAILWIRWMNSQAETGFSNAVLDTKWSPTQTFQIIMRFGSKCNNSHTVRSKDKRTDTM